MRGKGEGSVYKDERGIWRASIELPSHDGSRRRKVKSSADKGTVLRWLAEQRAELGVRGDLSTASPTLEWWSAYWLDRIAARRVRPNTLLGYRAALGHVTAAIGKTRLDKLTPAHVRRAEDAMRARGLSETTVLLSHRVLTKALSDARREGRVGQVVTQLMDAPRRAVQDVKALSVVQAVTVIAEAVPALAATPYDPLPALWATYLLTGARRGEVLGLELDRVGEQIDMSWQMQRITAGAPLPADYECRPIAGGLYWTRPKTRQGWRVLPLVEPLAALLREHVARMAANRYGLLFTLDGEPIDPTRASALWRAVSPEPGVTLHGLRHTTVDLLYQAGVPEDVIQEIVGHSQRAVTRGYKTPAKLARRTTAMEQLSVLLTSDAGGATF